MLHATNDRIILNILAKISEEFITYEKPTEQSFRVFSSTNENCTANVQQVDGELRLATGYL